MLLTSLLTMQHLEMGAFSKSRKFKMPDTLRDEINKCAQKLTEGPASARQQKATQVNITAEENYFMLHDHVCMYRNSIIAHAITAWNALPSEVVVVEA